MELVLALLALLALAALPAGLGRMQGRALGHLNYLKFMEGSDSLEVPESRRKVWKRDPVFSSAEHWLHAAPPCPGDRVVFPRDLRGAAVYLDKATVEVREVLLPWSGEVVLPSSGSLVIGGEDFRSKSCPGKDVEWRASPAPSWLDPGNWLVTAPGSDPEAVPHLERIPCGQDVASFQHLGFRVTLPEFPVRVGALYINGYVLTDSDMWMVGSFLSENLLPARPWLSARDGLQLMSSGPRDLEELGPQCGLPAGAAEDEEAAGELMRAVCQHVTCPVPACARPVRPHLHCCYECGAVLELSPSPDLASVRRLVRDVQLEYGVGAGPLVHVGAVPSAASPGMLQVVLLGDTAEEFGALLMDRIRADGSLSHVRATLLLSGAVMAPATTGSVLGTLLGSLLIVILVIGVLVYVRERPSSRLFLKQSSFLFARFENAPGEEDGVAVNVVSTGVRSARGSWSARSFRNPLYEQQDAPLTRGVAHENALFTELQRRVEAVNGELDVHQDQAGPAPPEEDQLDEKLVDVAL